MKATARHIQAIRDAHRAGYSCVSIAEAFGRTKSMVSLIVNGQSWAHIPDVPGPVPSHPALKMRCSGRAKLTPDSVQAIRDLVRAGHHPADVAAHYDVQEFTVVKIVEGKAWQHVPDVPAAELPTIRVNPMQSHEDIRVIRALLATGYTFKSVAETFNLLRHHVEQFNGDEWDHLDDVPVDIKPFIHAPDSALRRRGQRKPKFTAQREEIEQPTPAEMRQIETRTA